MRPEERHRRCERAGETSGCGQRSATEDASVPGVELGPGGDAAHRLGAAAHVLLPPAMIGDPLVA